MSVIEELIFKASAIALPPSGPSPLRSRLKSIATMISLSVHSESISLAPRISLTPYTHTPQWIQNKTHVASAQRGPLLQVRNPALGRLERRPQLVSKPGRRQMVVVEVDVQEQPGRYGIAHRRRETAARTPKLHRVLDF